MNICCRHKQLIQDALVESKHRDDDDNETIECERNRHDTFQNKLEPLLKMDIIEMALTNRQVCSSAKSNENKCKRQPGLTLASSGMGLSNAVSYTHLTLPTNREV